MLAKALYDNLADAPDELSFRKGDIVTVIEQDVDGLVGWWLCLLHGRQGIAPGNRLKVLPSIDDDKKKSPNQLLSSNDPSYSFDSVDGRSNPNLTQTLSEYDVLPAPVKASHGQLFESPSPKTLQEVYASKQNSPPIGTASSNAHASQSDYDILPKRGAINSGTKLNPEELYDIPTSPVQIDAVYDVIPNRKSIQSPSIFRPNSPLPKIQNVLSAFTAIPEGDGVRADHHSKSTELSNSSIYDAPKLTGNSPADLYDYPPNVIATKKEDIEKSFMKTGSNVLYDTPKNDCDSQNVKPILSNEDFYSTPPQSGTAFRKNFNFSLLRQDNSTPLSQGKTANDLKLSANEELYDVPIQFNASTNRTAELYDKPIPQQTVQHSGIYDIPSSAEKRLIPSSSDNIDIPLPNADGAEIYDTPPKRDNDTSLFTKPNIGQEMKANFNEIYDVPPAHNKQYDSTSTEVYDIPRSKNLEQYDIYDSPINAVASGQQHFVGDAIYDTPPSTDIYDTPSSEQIYDQPKNTRVASVQGKVQEAGNNSGMIGDDLYDTPTKHDVNKVMNDIARFKTTNQSFTKGFSKRHDLKYNGSGRTSNHDDDDDYVDYQDIYGKEPPAEMVKEMEKVITSFDRQFLIWFQSMLILLCYFLNSSLVVDTL